MQSIETINNISVVEGMAHKNRGVLKSRFRGSQSLYQESS